MVQWMLERGVHGFYVLGGTGEGAVLTEKERMRMAEAAAQAMEGSGRKLIVHVGAADVHSARRLARHAASIGADAISSVYPNFFCRYTQQEALRYYQALIDDSGLPMLGYCQNMMQGEDVLNFVEQLMKLDGTIGIKYTFPDYYRLQRIKQLGNINVINGPDETLLCGLCMGADGGIGSTYNLMPGWFVKLYEAFVSDHPAEACLMQQKINRVIAVLLRYGVIPAVKLGMEAFGFDAGHAAFPAVRYTQEQREEIIAAFRQARLFDE